MKHLLKRRLKFSRVSRVNENVFSKQQIFRIKFSTIWKTQWMEKSLGLQRERKIIKRKNCNKACGSWFYICGFNHHKRERLRIGSEGELLSKVCLVKKREESLMSWNNNEVFHLPTDVWEKFSCGFVAGIMRFTSKVSSSSPIQFLLFTVPRWLPSSISFTWIIAIGITRKWISPSQTKDN